MHILRTKEGGIHQMNSLKHRKAWRDFIVTAEIDIFALLQASTITFELL